MTAPWDSYVVDEERYAWADVLRDPADQRDTKLAIVHGVVCIFDRYYNDDGTRGGFVCREVTSVEDCYLGEDVVVGPFVDLIRCSYDGAVTIGGDPGRHSVYLVHCAGSGRILIQGDGRNLEACKQVVHNHDPVPFWV